MMQQCQPGWKDGAAHWRTAPWLTTVDTILKPCDDLARVPLPEGEVDMTLFVDGSCSKEEHERWSGYALVRQFQATTWPHCPADMLAATLTEACYVREDKSVNIYTDSAYAHGVLPHLQHHMEVERIHQDRWIQDPARGGHPTAYQIGHHQMPHSSNHRHSYDSWQQCSGWSC